MIDITKVTQALEKSCKEFAVCMISEYLSCETSAQIEKAAEGDILQFYKIAKWDLPEQTIWLDSPFDEVYLKAVDSAVDSAVRSVVRSAVDSAVDSAVRSAVYSAVDSAVDSVVYSAVDSAVDSYYWANYLSFYEYFNIHWRKNDLHPMAEFTRKAAGATIINKTLYLFRKPKELHRDKRGRLHSILGPAFLYRDGKGFNFIHGVQVSENIVLHPEALTKRDWYYEKNLEVRRIIQDQMKERFVTEIGGKVIKKHKDLRIGEIIEIDISPDPEKIARYLHAQDWSTDRMYFLRIPPSISDPMEAQAWTYAVNIKDLKPKYRT
jgi:hypothetical protein